MVVRCRGVKEGNARRGRPSGARNSDRHSESKRQLPDLQASSTSPTTQSSARHKTIALLHSAKPVWHACAVAGNRSRSSLDECAGEGSPASTSSMSCSTPASDAAAAGTPAELWLSARPCMPTMPSTTTATIKDDHGSDRRRDVAFDRAHVVMSLMIRAPSQECGPTSDVAGSPGLSPVALGHTAPCRTPPTGPATRTPTSCHRCGKASPRGPDVREPRSSPLAADLGSSRGGPAPGAAPVMGSGTRRLAPVQER